MLAMTGEVDKAVQQDQSVVPAPPADPPESRDVEMSEAPAAKETEQPGQAAPTPADGIAIPSAPHETAVTNANQPAAAADKAQAEEKPIAESTGPVPQDAPLPPAKEAEVDAADKTPKPAPDQAAVEKVEVAEDASVKMLAANLDARSEGTPVAEPTRAEADSSKSLENGVSSITAGEKRKAEDNPEANGDSSKKMAIVEETNDTPATNGSAVPRKPGRPKKGKKLPAPVGRTARRTRSQGAADI